MGGSRGGVYLITHSVCMVKKKDLRSGNCVGPAKKQTIPLQYKGMEEKMQVEKQNKILEFRLLKAEEIDCRIATANANGVSLLLYKDARVDQSILDETVGALNWQRHHSRDNANCVVSIWDDTKNQWIEKEDTGTESNAEKAKGLASDSFKRACFNWGIGRELYTVPFIWISKNACTLKEVEDRGKKKYTCYDRFFVQSIEYNDERKVIGLVIVNETKGGMIAYQMGHTAGSSQNESQKDTYSNRQQTERVQEFHIQTLHKECKRTGLNWRQICVTYNVRQLSDLTIAQYKDAICKFSRYPNVPDPGNQSSALDHLEDDGLPWNTPGR